MGEALEEILAVEQLHHDERLIAVDAVIEDLDDVGAAELGGGRRLATEALAGGLLLGQLGVDELDGDVRGQREVLRDPNRRLRSLPDGADQPIALA